MENLENEVLNDDELYAKIETEKLLKRKKTKRIVTISTLCVAMVLAIVVIIMAAVPISLKPRCINSGFDDVSLYSGNSISAVLHKGDEEYDKFINAYNKAFSQTYLTALFSGSLNHYEINEDYTLVDEKNSFTTIKTKASTDRLVRLRFNEEHVFTNQNGKAFQTGHRVGGTLTFTEAYLEISSNAGVQDAKVFIVANYPNFKDGEIESTEQHLIVVTVKADTSVIDAAWENLI